MTTYRTEILDTFVRGKTVLDIGCVSNRPYDSDKAGKLHKYLCSRSDHVLGVDIDQEGIKRMASHGYNVQHCDAQRLDFKDRFDVVVAGNIIEHLDNPGLMLAGAYRALKTGGHLIMTTGNTFALRNILRPFLLQAVPVHWQHTCWYCPTTFRKIADNAGFKDIRIHYLFDNIDTDSPRHTIERLITYHHTLRPEILLIGEKI